MIMNMTPISDAIGRVFWFWRNQPLSPMLRENPASRLQLAGFPAEMLKAPEPMGAIVTAATPYGAKLHENAVQTATGCPCEPAASDGLRMETIEEEVQVCAESQCLRVFLRNEAQCPACGRAGMKSRRLRSRHKPLTVADIAAGGVYVPKKGNNKSPNIVVMSLGRSAAEEVIGVVWRRENEEIDEEFGVPNYDGIEEFLDIVARRIDA